MDDQEIGSNSCRSKVYIFPERLKRDFGSASLLFRGIKDSLPG